jgi:hypothetical protein
MNLQIAILKVLSSYPDGRASYASLKSDLHMLSDLEWLNRMRALGARAGAVNIFSAKLAARDASGWTITEAGRDFLDRLERGEVIKKADDTQRVQLRVVSSTSSGHPTPAPQPRLKLVRSA